MKTETASLRICVRYPTGSPVACTSFDEQGIAQMWTWSRTRPTCHFHKLDQNNVDVGLPHVVCLMIYYCLKRLGKGNLAISICAVYFAAWLFTATVGTFAVRRTIEKRFESRNVQNLQELAQTKGIVFNSQHFPSESDIDGPWYYCDRISAPCPFIIALDYGNMSETSGAGSRIFLLWSMGQV